MQTRLFAIVLFAIVALCGSAAAAIGDSPGNVIPSRMCRGIWIGPISFGEDPDQTLQFILDTGADLTSLDPDAIERVSSRRIREGKKIRLRNGVAGPLKIRSIKVVSHDMDKLSRALGTETDGIPVYERGCVSMNDNPRGKARVFSVRRGVDLLDIRVKPEVLVP
jgi:hypothetical protein